MSDEEKKSIMRIINGFTVCRARLRSNEDRQLSLIWASCYSYNNKVAKEFLQDKCLALLFLLSLQFILSEINRSANEIYKE